MNSCERWPRMITASRWWPSVKDGSGESERYNDDCERLTCGVEESVMGCRGSQEEEESATTFAGTNIPSLCSSLSEQHLRTLSSERPSNHHCEKAVEVMPPASQRKKEKKKKKKSTLSRYNRIRTKPGKQPTVLSLHERKAAKSCWSQNFYFLLPVPYVDDFDMTHICVMNFELMNGCCVNECLEPTFMTYV